MTLPNINTKKKFLDTLAELHKFSAESDDEERGRNRELKSYMLELNEPIPSEFTINDCLVSVKKTDLDHIKILRTTDHQQHSIEFYVDTENPRFNVLHTSELAKDADAFVHNLATSNQHQFDRAWIPTAMLSHISKGTNNELCGYGIQYEDIFSETDDIMPRYELSMNITGKSSDDVRKAIQKHSNEQYSTSYHKITIVHGTDYERIREDLDYNGRFIVKKGDSMDSHISLLDYVRDQYSAKMEMIENNRIGIEQRESNNMKLNYCVGSAFEFNFKRHIEDWSSYLKRIFNSREPFRVHGLIEKEDMMYRLLCIDMHTNDPLDIEVFDDVMRVYLPKNSCGNVVLRLFTNLQKYFDPSMSCKQLEWD